MKGILVVIDGMGDLPNSKLGDKTPLEAANKPYLDFLAARGELGYMYTVRPGFVPGSGEAVLSMFENDANSVSRGRLAAVGAGINLFRGDLALRTNFATISDLKKRKVIDRRAGRTLTTKEAQILAKAIMKEVKLPVKFDFVPTLQHRGVLVFRGGFSDMISNVDIEYTSKSRNESEGNLHFSEALNDDENSLYSANILNEFLIQSYEVLKDHPVNLKRKEKGLLPANFILARGAGAEDGKLKQYKKWAAFAYMPLEIGFSKMSGMSVYSFAYPKLKNFDVYANLHKGLKKACRAAIKAIKKSSRKGFDYIYVHIKEPDVPGHDNQPFEKKSMIEYIDKVLFSYISRFATKHKIKVAVTADHSTPCKLKSHSADPVPVLLYNDQKPEKRTFNEKESRKGTLGRIEGKDFLKKIGFVR